MSADVVSAIAAAASAVVAIFALVIAARSAAAAKSSAESAVATLRRSAVRELIGLCHDVLAENLRIIELVGSLESEYKSLFALSGASGGSRDTTLRATLAEDMAAANSLASEATALGDELGKLQNASDDDVDQMTIRLMRARTRIRAIRESIKLQLTETRTSKQQPQGENV